MRLESPILNPVDILNRWKRRTRITKLTLLYSASIKAEINPTNPIKSQNTHLTSISTYANFHQAFPDVSQDSRRKVKQITGFTPLIHEPSSRFYSIWLG